MDNNKRWQGCGETGTYIAGGMFTGGVAVETGSSSKS